MTLWISWNLGFWSPWPTACKIQAITISFLWWRKLERNVFTFYPPHGIRSLGRPFQKTARKTALWRLNALVREKIPELLFCLGFEGSGMHKSPSPIRLKWGRNEVPQTQAFAWNTWTIFFLAAPGKKKKKKNSGEDGLFLFKIPHEHNSFFTLAFVLARTTKAFFHFFFFLETM